MPHLSRRYAALVIALSAVSIGLGGSTAVLGQGGARLLFQIDVERLRSQRLDSLRDDVRGTTLQEPRLAVEGAMEARDGAVTLRIRDAAQAALARARLQALAEAMNAGPVREVEFAEPEPGRFALRLTEPGLNERARVAADESLRIVRRRFDLQRTSGITIAREGDDRLLVLVPDGQDLEAVKRLVVQPGQLTLRLVDPSITTLLPPAGRQSDSELLPSEDGGPVMVQRLVLLSGEDLLDVAVGFSQQTNQPVINFRFNENGTRRFAQVTRDNVGRALAIVLDDRVLSAPVIREPILGGIGQISGNFTVQSANDLAILLRSGALPVRLVPMEERRP